MKKTLLFFTLLLLFSCFNDTIENNCFSGITASKVLNLSNPEFNELLTIHQSVTTSVQTRNVIVINSGTSGFKAFDAECPEGDCNSNMTFDFPFIECSCSKKRYSVLNGSPVDGDGCFALEYNVLESSNSTLQISI